MGEQKERRVLEGDVPHFPNIKKGDTVWAVIDSRRRGLYKQGFEVSRVQRDTISLIVDRKERHSLPRTPYRAGLRSMKIDGCYNGAHFFETEAEADAHLAAEQYRLQSYELCKAIALEMESLKTALRKLPNTVLLELQAEMGALRQRYEQLAEAAATEDK